MSSAQARRSQDPSGCANGCGTSAGERLQLMEAIERLGLLYRVDGVFLDQPLPPSLRSLIERDKRLFWAGT